MGVREVRRPGGIAARTAVTGLLAGAIAGLLTMLVTFAFLLAEAGGSPGFASLVGLLPLALLSMLVGSPLGLLVAGTALAVLIPLAGWARHAEWRARLLASCACVLSLAAWEAVYVAFTYNGGPSLWFSAHLLVPPLVMAGAAGIWRGPDLLLAEAR